MPAPNPAIAGSWACMPKACDSVLGLMPGKGCQFLSDDEVRPPQAYFRAYFLASSGRCACAGTARAHIHRLCVKGTAGACDASHLGANAVDIATWMQHGRRPAPCQRVSARKGCYRTRCGKSISSNTGELARPASISRRSAATWAGRCLINRHVYGVRQCRPIMMPRCIACRGPTTSQWPSGASDSQSADGIGDKSAVWEQPRILLREQRSICNALRPLVPVVAPGVALLAGKCM